MPIFKEIPPTSGWPFHAKDLKRLFVKADLNTLEGCFKNYLAADYSRVTYSGTAALYFIFETLKKISHKRTIIIPAYVCPLVALAAQKAKLHIKVCDINPEDFNYNYTDLERICSKESDVLAIVGVHLGGIVLDLDKIQALAEKYGIFTIEDCAHSLGAKYKGKKCGTLGDFSFFSLCRGKGITIYEGGIVISNKKEHSHILNETITGLAYKNYFSEIIKVIELFGYWIFYRPWLFWFVFGLPQAFWRLRGKKFKVFGEDYDTAFDIHEVSAFRKSLGQMSFYRLEEELALQKEKASFYINELSGIDGIKIVFGRRENENVYPFLTLVFSDAIMRDRALEKLRQHGLGASIVYLNSICDYDYLKEVLDCESCDNARSLAKRQLTLSTNSFLKNKDLKLIVDTLKELMRK